MMPMIEITATDLDGCSWPGCRQAIAPGDRIVYETADGRPYHAVHQEADE